jgi:hypothetical protein
MRVEKNVCDVLERVLDLLGVVAVDGGGIDSGKAAADPDEVLTAGDAGITLGDLFQRAE